MSFFEDAAPLLEVEWNTCFNTLFADVTSLIAVHRPGSGAGFSADYDPVDAIKV